MSGGDRDLGSGAGGEQGLNGPRERTSRRDHVVDDQAGPAAHIADDVRHGRLGGIDPTLVEDHDRGVELMCILGRHLDPSGIR